MSASDNQSTYTQSAELYRRLGIIRDTVERLAIEVAHFREDHPEVPDDVSGPIEQLSGSLSNIETKVKEACTHAKQRYEQQDVPKAHGRNK